MAIGMTYDQYWYGDPLMVRAFYEAHKLKLRLQDENNWLLGRYFADAILATVGNQLSGKGEFKYPEEPYMTEHNEEEYDEPSESDLAYVDAYMDQWVRVGRNWGKKEGEDDANN